MTRSSPSSYDEDFFAWTQEQAAALRAAQGGRLAEGLDLARLAEEVEDSGRRDLRDVTSNLSRFFEHLIKIVSAPGAGETAHWLGEALNFQIAAFESFSPSMRRLIDLEPIWQQGRLRAETALEGMGIDMRAPITCPFELNELLVQGFDLKAARQRVLAPRE